MAKLSVSKLHQIDVPSNTAYYVAVYEADKDENPTQVNGDEDNERLNNDTTKPSENCPEIQEIVDTAMDLHIPIGGNMAQGNLFPLKVNLNFSPHFCYV